MTPKKWLKEPLVHFLAAGAMLYMAASLLGPSPDSGRTIVIDEDQLAASLMQRTGMTDAVAVKAALAALPQERRDKLLHDTAAEEALWREGRALGLDTVDGVVRLRTVSQMRLLLAEEASAGLTVSEAEVSEYYTANRAAYAEPAAASFSHLYFAGPQGEAHARAALAQLRQQPASEIYGDRFLYQSTYSDAGAEELTGQFGRGFVEALLALSPGAKWQGPLRSDHGWHIVVLRQSQPALVPPLASIEPQVREDALLAKRSKVAEAAVDRLLENYEVRTR